MAVTARAAAATETGCLVIADISGYTGYLVEGPLEFTEDVVSDVLDTIAARLGAVLRVNEREGDALFTHAFADEADASMLLDAVEECYFASRYDRLAALAKSRGEM